MSETLVDRLRHASRFIDQTEKLADLCRIAADEIERLVHQTGPSGERDQALEEVERLTKILNTPILEPFADAVVAEARHQVYRWGEEHDAKKTAWDWFWSLGYLGGKAAHSALAGDWDKAKHHTITAAALLANWHRHICDQPAIRAMKGGGAYHHNKCNSCGGPMSGDCPSCAKAWES